MNWLAPVLAFKVRELGESLKTPKDQKTLRSCNKYSFRPSELKDGAGKARAIQINPTTSVVIMPMT